MSEKLSFNTESEPEWEEVFCYFGNANWPSDTTYRKSGSRIQVRIETPREDGGWDFESKDLTEPDELEQYRQDIRYS